MASKACLKRLTRPNPVHFLPYGTQTIDRDDEEMVLEVLRSSTLTGGPYVARFEAELCEKVGATETVAVSNGTAALHLAALALGLSSDHAVIVPTVTFLSSANAMALCGARVIFADVDEKTGLMTYETYLEAFEHLKRVAPHLRYGGVVAVHLAGRPVRLEAISNHARAHGGFVIEDAAHALGTQVSGQPVGACAHSDCVTFSFHPVKTITTGEGGAVCVKNGALGHKVRALRSHGIERDPSKFRTLKAAPWVYEMVDLGLNYRLPDLNCALGLSQLKKLSGFVEARARLVNAYQTRLSGIDGIFWQPPQDDEEISFHLYAPLFDFQALQIDRATLMTALKARGIGSQVHYIPVSSQPYWLKHQLGARSLMGAQSYYDKTLSLPLYPSLTEADIDDVTAIVLEEIGC